MVKINVKKSFLYSEISRTISGFPCEYQEIENGAFPENKQIVLISNKSYDIIGYPDCPRKFLEAHNYHKLAGARIFVRTVGNNDIYWDDLLRTYSDKYFSEGLITIPKNEVRD